MGISGGAFQFYLRSFCGLIDLKGKKEKKTRKKKPTHTKEKPLKSNIKKCSHTYDEYVSDHIAHLS